MKPIYLLVVACLLIAACDSDNDAIELRNRITVASQNLAVLEITSVNSVVAVNGAQALVLLAGATVADVDYTSRALWSSSDRNVATVSDQGVVNGVADGSVIITAKLGPLTQSIDLTVSSAGLISISIAAPEMLNECDSTTLVANGSFADGTDRVITDAIWTVDNTPAPGAFSETTNGLFRSSAAGTATITAAQGDISNAISLVVSNNLASINLTPEDVLLSTNVAQQFTATAAYSDNDDTPDITDNVSWSVGDENTSSIDNTLPGKGEFTSTAFGEASITAKCNEISVTKDLTVGDATVVERLRFQELNSPFTIAFDDEQTINLIAEAVLETTDAVVVTNDVKWTIVSETDGGFELSDEIGSKGVLTILGVGKVTVQIEYIGDAFDEEKSNLSPQQLEIVVN